MRQYNALFLCTGNSARSIMAEAILEKESEGRFRAYSAGSHPKGDVHPETLRLLGELGYDVDAFRSQSWDDYAADGAPALDFVFTVCDDAAGEVCPAWPGQPMTAHWGIPDPAAAEEDEQPQAFWRAYCALRARIQLFLALPLESIDEMSLQSKLREIGRTGDQDAA